MNHQMREMRKGIGKKSQRKFYKVYFAIQCHLKKQYMLGLPSKLQHRHIFLVHNDLWPVTGGRIVNVETDLDIA